MISQKHEHYSIYVPVREELFHFIEYELMGKSKDTQRTYYYSLEQFFEFVLLNYFDTLPSYDERIINAYLKHFENKEGRKLSVSYINRCYAAISAFSEYKGVNIDRKKIRLPKSTDIRQVQPRSLKEEKVDDIEEKLYIKYVKQKEKNRNPYKVLPSTSKERDTFRNYVIYRLMVQTGIRISEAVGLNFEDLHLEGKREESRYLEIRGKNNKERRVPIPLELKDLLEMYIKFRNDYDIEIEYEKLYFKIINDRLNKNVKEEILLYLNEEEMQEKVSIVKKLTVLDGNKDEESKKERFRLKIKQHGLIITGSKRYIESKFRQNRALFVSNRGNRVSKDAMIKMFAKLGIKSHELRHTSIKTLVDSNVSLNKIMSITGHSNPEMVLRYSKPTFQEIQEAVEQKQKKFNRKL